MSSRQRYDADLSARAHLACWPECAIDTNPAYSMHFDGHGDTVPEVGVAYLPHQCEAWVIGGAEEVRAMIGDLQSILAMMERPTE